MSDYSNTFRDGKRVKLPEGAKHTPGPWRAHGDAVFSPDGCIAICGTDLLTPATNEANARLIAAASDMLAALQYIMGKLGSYHDADDDDAEMHIIADIEKTLEAAIAKAKGET